MGLFGGKASGSSPRPEPGRTLRHSSGWGQMSKHLRSHESLRILDIGPTSAGNINFVTGLGHSIYMANLVDDASKPEYRIAPTEGETKFDVARFLKQNLEFSGRTFDVVTLWDTADYLPDELVQPVIDRLCEVMDSSGQLLALFHSKPVGPDTEFSRFHLTDSDQVEMQRIGGHPVLHTYTNRQIESMFSRFAGFKFFLAKDSLREVMVTR